MKYTVLLLRPDYIASSYGQDTYLVWVDAPSVEEAQVLAQREAYRFDVPLDDGGHDESDYLPDYHVLFVVEGHIVNMAV